MQPAKVLNHLKNVPRKTDVQDKKLDNIDLNIVMLMIFKGHKYQKL